ncbi:hypothetical protein [Arthrobacter psychrochitiniphilus]|uniref:hypothetical protein n=1 Tax=Arthrobacter psychrochitiniphilus TaxID=291045 RepID=UPI003F7B9F0B
MVVGSSHVSESWLVMTDLGKRFGWNSNEVGLCLRFMGLRDAEGPGAAPALEMGLAREQPDLDGKGIPFVRLLWDAEVLIPAMSEFIEQNGGLVSVTENLRDELKARRVSVTPRAKKSGSSRQAVQEGAPDSNQLLFLIQELTTKVNMLELEVKRLGELRSA